MQSKTNYRSGVLLHPTSLPGNSGIGEIGPDAYRFVDNLYKMGPTHPESLISQPLF